MAIVAKDRHGVYSKKRRAGDGVPLDRGSVRYYSVVKGRWSRGFTTRKEAQEHEAGELLAVRNGTRIETTRRTFADYLEGEWLPAVQRRVRPSTYQHYAAQVRYILPVIGNRPLQKVAPADLDHLYTQLAKNGRIHQAGRTAGLSPKSVRHVHATIRTALRDAVRRNLVTRNVAEAVDPPKITSTELTTWTGDELNQFVTSVRDDRLFALWLLYARRGLRRGEALALTWRDLDIEHRTLRVERASVVVDYQPIVSEPKTAAGRRTIPLSDELLDAFAAHRTAQKRERLAWGEGYEDNDLIFRQQNGAPLHPQRVSAWFTQRVTRSGLPRVRLHDVRHSFATAWIAQGGSIKTLSTILGHASVTITMGLYVHDHDEATRTETARLDALMAGD